MIFQPSIALVKEGKLVGQRMALPIQTGRKRQGYTHAGASISKSITLLA